jgi:hypothetical protein
MNLTSVMLETIDLMLGLHIKCRAYCESVLLLCSTIAVTHNTTSDHAFSQWWTSSNLETKSYLHRPNKGLSLGMFSIST